MDFQHDQKWLAWAVIIYGFCVSALPVWLLLTPRDYLSTFLKLGAVAALAVAVVIIHPPLQMPALSRFIDGTGLVFAGPVSPLSASRSPVARFPVFARSSPPARRRE
ncbi:MAG: carbon starvation CstA family protein [Chthoniobacterales bacterium]